MKAERVLCPSWTGVHPRQHPAPPGGPQRADCARHSKPPKTAGHRHVAPRKATRPTRAQGISSGPRGRYSPSPPDRRCPWATPPHPPHLGPPRGFRTPWPAPGFLMPLPPPGFMTLWSARGRPTLRRNLPPNPTPTLRPRAGSPPDGPSSRPHRTRLSRSTHLQACPAHGGNRLPGPVLCSRDRTFLPYPTRTHLHADPR